MEVTKANLATYLAGLTPSATPYQIEITETVASDWGHSDTTGTVGSIIRASTPSGVYLDLSLTIIPNSVQFLPATFYKCTPLTTAPVIPNNVTDLGSTFHSCTALTTTPAIPSNVTNLNYTFYGCTSLTTAPAIPNSVINIGGAFRGCTLLHTIQNFAVDVDNCIMKDAFRDCPALTNIYVTTLTESSWHLLHTDTDATGTDYTIYNPDGTVAGSGTVAGTSQVLSLYGKSDELVISANITPTLAEETATSQVQWHKSGLPYDDELMIFNAKNPDTVISNFITVNRAGEQFLGRAKDSYPIPTDAVLQYSFDEIGDMIIDNSYSEAHAENHGVIPVDGVCGKAGYFNNSYMIAPRPALGDDITIYFWAKFDSLTGGMCIVQSRATVNVTGLYVFAGTLGYGLNWGGVSANFPSHTVPVNTWHHVTIKTNQTTRQLKINNVLVASATGTYTNHTNFSTNIIIGKSAVPDGNPLIGALDGLKIVPRYTTDDEDTGEYKARANHPKFYTKSDLTSIVTLRRSANFTLPTYLDGQKIRIANTHATNTITCTLPTGQTMNGQSSFTIAPDTLLEFELVGTAWKCVSNEWELVRTHTTGAINQPMAQFKQVKAEVFESNGGVEVSTEARIVSNMRVDATFNFFVGSDNYYGGVQIHFTGTTIVSFSLFSWLRRTYTHTKIYGMK